jgi:aspartate racemase
MALSRVGLIGGTSWESSAIYYRRLNETVRDRVGGQSSAALTLWSLDFAEIARFQEQGDWAALGKVLADAAQRLEQSGAQAIAVAANTLHLCAEDITAAITVPFVDIVDVTFAECRRRGMSRVGLLGTGYTMRSPLFADRFAPAGIEVIVPGEADRVAVHRVIYDELTRGVVSERSRREYLGVVARLAADGAEAVILGCTEIDLLITDGDADVPLLDTAGLHCAALADLIINGVPS